MKVYKKVSGLVLKKIVDVCKKYSLSVTDKNLIYMFKYNNVRINIYCNNTVTFDGNDNDVYKLEILFNLIDKQSIDQKMIVKDETNLNGCIGCDEVGTGDYFGPVITCCCFIENSNILKIKALGIDDSKKMNDTVIIDVYKKLITLVEYSVVICLPNDYNKQIDLLKNSNILKAKLHNEGLIDLTNKLSSNKYQIVMDQFANEKNYYSYLEKINAKKIKIDLFVTKAESKYLSVAAASVIARANFIDQMNILSKKCNFVLPYGSSQTNQIVKAGKKISQSYALTDFAKIHFASITKLINS